MGGDIQVVDWVNEPLGMEEIEEWGREKGMSNIV